MPTYEYKCNKCDHEFEAFQLMSDDALDTCPVCKGAVERLISGGGGLIFKGSGFYITDYRSDSYKKAEKADRPSSASTTKKTETKSDNKKKTVSSKKE